METLEKSRVCRLCGKHSGISIDIFDKNDNHFKKINSILPISVHEMDLLPKQICHRCSYKLEEFHKFYIECLKTDTTLKNQLSWMCKETDNKTKKSNGVPMVQIENVKIKCEPHEIDPLLKSVGLIEFPLHEMESDLPECLLYTTFTNTSRCQCYCDNKSDPTTGKEAISKDCRHINLPKTPDFIYLDDNQTAKNSDILWKKQEARNLFATSKELRALSKSGITVDNSLIRNLRPRKRSVDYVGGKRKNRSSESLERPQSTEPPTTIIITNDHIKNEPIDNAETARTLRPRKQLKTEVKTRSKSADRSKSKAQSEIRELKIKREVVDEIVTQLDVRLDGNCEKVDKTGKKWRELYIGIERSDILGSNKKRCVRSVSVCFDSDKRDRKEKSDRSVSRCEPIYGNNLHSAGRKSLNSDDDNGGRVRIRESAKDLQENRDQGLADKAASKEFNRDRRSVSRNRGNTTDSAASKGCSRDRQSISRERQSVSKEVFSFSKDNSSASKEGSTNTAASKAFVFNATAKGCAIINAACKTSALNNSAVKASADPTQLTASSANEEANINAPFNKSEKKRNEHTAHTDNTSKDDLLASGHTFAKNSFSKEATSENILNKEGTIKRSCNFTKDRGSITKCENAKDTNTRSIDSNKSINTNSKNTNSINTNSKNTNSINTIDKSINIINTTDNSNKNNNTSEKSIDIETKRNKESTKSTIYINKNLNIITANMKKNGANFLKNRQTNKELMRNRLRNIGNKERKLQLKRLPMQFSPKMLRSHDLCLRSGRIKVTNTHHHHHHHHHSQKKNISKDIKINYLEKFNEAKSKFLNHDVKHLCEKCNYTFANKELFRLHACYSN